MMPVASSVPARSPLARCFLSASVCRLWIVLVASIACGCASVKQPEVEEGAQFPPAPSFPPDHLYTLDDLVALSIHRNASLDVARYEAESVQGLVDQVKALWLPSVRFDLAAVAYSNDLSYKARALDLLTLNVPITGAYNIVSSLGYAQILATGGKRTSGLKQARMFAEIKKLDVLRQQDAVAFDVATYFHLICLTTDIDTVLEDSERRLRVYRQVAQELNRNGSLRASGLDGLQADFFVSQLEQLRVAVQAGRRQAYGALRHFVGVSRDELLELKSASLPEAPTPLESFSAYGTVMAGFIGRPEAHQLELFAAIRAEQVKFAKAAWQPNIATVGTYVDTQGNHHTILETIDGLIASLIIDIPLYDAGRLGKLREALGLEQASLAFQRQFEDLITLEIEVAAIDAQKALTIVLKTARAKEIAAEYYDGVRQAYSRELVPTSEVVMAIGLDTVAKILHSQALYAYHDSRAKLKRVTADREAQYGY